MPGPITPAKKLANGRDTWWLVPAGADINAPKLSEVNSATGLNLAGVLMNDYEGPSSSTDKVALPRVLLETVETEVNAPTKFSLGDIQCTFQPQAAAGSDGKKAWELVNGGTFVGWAVRRQDKAATTGDAVTGEFVDVLPVQIGQPIPGKSSTGADGIYMFTAPVSVTGTPAWNKAVAA